MWPFSAAIIRHQIKRRKRNESKDYKGAIEDFNKAIALDAKNTDTYYNRGNARSGLKQYKEAIGDYDKAIALDPKYAKAFSNRGVAKLSVGDKPGGCADLNTAAALGNAGAAEKKKIYCQ